MWVGVWVVFGREDEVTLKFGGRGFVIAYSKFPSDGVHEIQKFKIPKREKKTVNQDSKRIQKSTVSGNQ